MKKNLFFELVVIFLIILTGSILFTIICTLKDNKCKIIKFSNDTSYFSASIPEYKYRPHFIHYPKNNSFTPNVKYRNYVLKYPENYQNYINFYNNFNYKFDFNNYYNNPIIYIDSNDLTYIFKSKYDLLIKNLKEKPLFCINGKIDTIKLYSNNNMIITLKDENFDNGTLKVFISKNEINTEKIFKEYSNNSNISLYGYFDTEKTSKSSLKFYCISIS